MNKKTLTAAIATLAVLGTTSVVNSAYADDKEKCYGVVKAGKNDCATKTSSCVGTSKRDSQDDAFIVLPAGVCDKLTGGFVGA